MTLDRRTVVTGAAALAGAGCASTPETERATMHGLIGRMTAVSGKRDELIAVLLEGTATMPGCLSYVVANDPAEPDAIWITEVWTDEASHKASLALPAVKAAIAKGRPMIAGFGPSTVTRPVGGAGLASAPQR